MRRAVWLSLAGLIISTLTVVAGPSASADPGAQAVSNLVNMNSGQCLDIFDASQAPGAGAIQWPCNGDTNQAFEEIAAPGGGVFLRALHSSQCLDVFNADLAPGTRVIQWPCNFENNQRFSRTFYFPGGSVRYRAVHSGLCLDVLWGSTNPGTWIIQWHCHNGATQRWF